MWKTIQTGAKYAAAFLHSAAATAAHLIIEYPEELSRVFAFLLTAYVMFGWISSNRNTPAIIFVILACLLMYPVSYVICFIFFLLCSIILRTASSLYHILFGGHYSWNTEKDTSSQHKTYRKTYSYRHSRTYDDAFGQAEEEFYRKFQEGGYENFEEFWNAQYGNQSESHKTEENRQESKQYQQQNTGSHKNQQSQTQEQQKLQQALAYFGLSFPFTEDELKTKWKRAMKKAHPDAGGTEAEAKRINQYFELLKKYAG